MAALGARALLLALCVLTAAALASSSSEVPVTPVFSRKSFPPGFVFGAASSAYQYEGAAAEDGRGPSIWDTFSHTHPEKIKDGSSGDVAIDFYHRYKEDVSLMKDIGLDAFRFSISWTRILPNGSLSGGVNQLGINFYNNLIDELQAKGVQPYVTLFHWDFPQGLESEYQGFLNPRVVDDFRDFADVCFKAFGDRVKHWITLNEPWSYCSFGYSAGTFAPGRCSPFQSANCSAGDSGKEPYLCAHHLILAHAAAVNLYKQKYQASQKGVIGVTLVSHWFLPYSSSKSDYDALYRALDFMLGWFMDPISEGDYPFSMRAVVGDRLPKFSEEESKMVKGSFDFLGLNYYTTYYAKSVSLLTAVNVSYDSDSHTLQGGIRRGVPIGIVDASKSIFFYPKGIRDLLVYVKDRYRNPTIYITENGFDEFNNASLPLEKALQDNIRIEYYQQHLSYIREAIGQGVNVKGYITWSFMDNYEWNSGYTLRFGMVFVDYKNGLKRYPKKSAQWFTKFLHPN